MGISLNPQQQAAINAYRKKHKIAPIITDDAVVSMIKKEGGNAASIFNDNKWATKQYKSTYNNSTPKTKKTNQTKCPPPDKKTQNKELKDLELINTNGAGTKVKSKTGKEYTLVGNASNGRKIVKDAKGQYQILAHDGTFLNKEVIKKNNKINAIKTNSQTAHSATINTMQKQLASAQKSFNHQLSQDGWAGDIADGISVLWGSDNRASKVRVDLNEYNKNIQDLQKAAKKGDAQFNAKFKQIYGKDFNQQAMAEYAKNPTQKNYEKVFGTKNNIYARVQNYNNSQQTGAEVVKTSAKVTSGIVIGAATVATGGAAGLAITAVGTALSSAAIDETDRINISDAVTKGKIKFREGTDHKKILTDAAFDGVSTLTGGAVGKIALTTVKGASTGAKITRAAINVAGDVGVGTAQEYVETGHISKEGVISNALMSGVGGAVVSGTLKTATSSLKFTKRKIKSFKAKIENHPQKLNQANNVAQTAANKKISTNRSTTTSVSTPQNMHPNQVMNEKGELLAGGSFLHKFSVSNLFGHSKTKLSPKDLMKQAENNISKQIKEGDPGTVHISRKLKEELSFPTIAKEFSSEIDLNNINSLIKSGEVCAVGTGTNQKLYVNNNGTAKEIQLSRETFDRLFPQGGFAMTSQKANNNCWILSRINAMTGSNTGKAELYSMFKELPNGDIQILLPNGNKPITFPKGKPVKTNSAKQIQEGGAPGVEMLQQAVQATRIQKAEKTQFSNIEDFSIEKLNSEESRMGLDSEAANIILDNNKFTTKRINDNQYADLENTLNSFNPREDMGTITFEAHARTLVDYNPQTKMVTYHNPYNGGVDITCPLEDLKKKSAHFAISRLKQKATVKNATTQTVSTQTQSTPMRKREIPKPTEQKTNIVRDNFREIAKTADGTPINAMISGNSVIINKNGNNLEIPLSEIKGNSFYKNQEVSLYCIKETSTNSYIILEADKRGAIRTRSVKNEDEMYKLIDEFDNNTKQKFNSTTPNTSNDTVRAEITPKQPSKTSQTTSGTTEASDIYKTGKSKNEKMNVLVQKYAATDTELKNRLYDLDITMSQVEDPQIRKTINAELERLANTPSSSKISSEIEDLQELVDAVNVRNGKYSINDIDYDNSFDTYHEFIKYANKNGKSLVKPNGEIDEKVLQDALGDINTYATDVVRDSFDAKNIFVSNDKIKNIVANLKPDDKIWAIAKERQRTDLKYVKQDFEMAKVDTPLVNFIEHQPNSKAASYLYDKYLSDLKTNGFSEDAISLCKNLSDKYNVRVFLSSQENPELALKEVTKEIEKWRSVSAGKAKLPATINFSKVNSMWYSIGEYGTRGGRAYSRMSENGGINFKTQTPEAVKKSFRHEITHSNDTHMILSETELSDGYNYNEIFPEHTLGELPKTDNLKYADELRNAGISDKYISYAHTNPLELIAVASEGNMSAYSPKFKKVLVDFGMPEWLFNIDGNIASTPRTSSVLRQTQNVVQQSTQPKMRVDMPNDKPITRTENTAKYTAAQTVSTQTQSTPMRKREIPKPTEQKTNIVRDNFREIAKTADGTPINAMISGNSVIINKNGNNLEIPLSEIKTNSFYKNSKVSLYCVKETSTNSYIVIEADRYGTIRTRSVKNEDEMYKLIDEFDNNTKQPGNPSTTRLNSGNISTSNNNPQSQPISTKPARIAVPKGFIVNQEVNGKRTLISTDGKARILMERNNRWMEIDNNGRFRQYNGD